MDKEEVATVSALSVEDVHHAYYQTVRIDHLSFVPYTYVDSSLKLFAYMLSKTTVQDLVCTCL